DHLVYEKDANEDGEGKPPVLTKSQRDERTFARSLACLKFFAEGSGAEFRSFGWIAANLVLTEIEKCHNSGAVAKKKVTVPAKQKENVTPLSARTVIPSATTVQGVVELERSLEGLTLAARRAGMQVSNYS